MAEVGVSVAAKLAEYLVHPTLQQFEYLFCVGKISKNVQIRKEELTLQQRRVLELVQEAINRTDRIDSEVDKWKNDVESIIAEVENLEEQLMTNNGCLRGWCPTWTRYRLCKKLANRTERMIYLNTRSDHFNPFSHPVTVPDIEYHSFQNFKLFNSTRVAFDQLWQALHDDGSSIIGLWGMGGSGKTTLATEVGKKAKESQLFDRVVLTTISQSSEIRKIQGEIADTLGLELKEESEIGRAKRISLRLQNGERNLIIVDDVWARLNLEDIGIPMAENHQRSCKVVLTTRRLDVCTLMGCQHMIHLNLLKEDEAWALFQTHANVNDAAKEYVARAIVVECKGLPIAIVAVGTCLKGKGVDEMNVMLYQLRKAKQNIVDKGVRDAFACLELSYDYLATQEAKMLLLMCAMFPDDHKIDIEDLFRYGVGLNLCEDVDSLETIRSQVRANIKYLIDSSLLMHCSSKFSTGEECVTMHDVVRDFALWKASKEDRTIVINCTKELDKLIDDKGVKDCYAASSWYDEENIFVPRHSQLDAPNLKFQLDAPKLKFLMLCSRTHLEISHASFVGATGLHALVIMCVNGYMMNVQPQSIQWSFNLRSLQLRHLDLCDVSFVVSLTRLEILDLQGSKFERIPDGIENLNKLKLLDLSDCEIDECCYKVIGRCSQLEELYVSNHYHLSGNTNCYEFLVGPVALRKLRRYKLEIGYPRRNLLLKKEGVRYLFLSWLDMSVLGSIIKDLTRRATAIAFNELKGGSKSLMPNIVQAVEGMNDLTNLLLQSCSEIECITDEMASHKDVIVPVLDELELRDMNNLKQLHRGAYPCSLFQKLERLTIVDCPQLLHIFPPECNLGNLKFLFVSRCPKLTSLFSTSVACTLLSLEELRIDCCSELKHALVGEGGSDAWENSRFPKLKILCVVLLKLKNLKISKCNKLKFVLSLMINGATSVLPQLSTLTILDCSQMEAIFKCSNHGIDNERKIKFPNMEYMKLDNLPRLVNVLQGFKLHMEGFCRVEVHDCPNLMPIKGVTIHWTKERLVRKYALKYSQLNNNEALNLPFSVLNVGEIDTQSPTVEHTWQVIGDDDKKEINDSGRLMRSEQQMVRGGIVPTQVLSFQYLHSLEMVRCTKLKFLFSSSIIAHNSLPKLTSLTLSKCEELEELIAKNGEHQTTVISSLKKIKLTNLPNFKSVCQGRLEIQVALEVININNCPKFVDSSLGLALQQLGTISLAQVSREDSNVFETSSSNNANEERGMMLMMSRAERLYLEDSMNLMSIWEGPTSIIFQNLVSLSVIRCRRLKCMFPNSIIKSLPCLEKLYMEECEELEEIIMSSSSEEEEHHNHHHFPNDSSNPSLCFPQLRTLTVIRCSKLKWLFPSLPSTKHLPLFGYMMIQECSQLKELFNNSQVEIHEEEFNINNILPNLWHQEVEDCPMFSTTTLAALQSLAEYNNFKMRRAY